MTSVRYIPAISTDSGAIPVSTEVATHPRAGDNFEVQDVYIDGATSANVHTGATELRTFSAGHVCTENSTSAPLVGNATFAGAGQDTLDYSEVIITVYADKTSATDGLKIWWSADNVTYDPDPDVFTISANVSKTFSFPCNRRYVKITYTNGATGQTLFLLSTLLKRYASKGSSHRLLDSLNQEDDAIVCKTLIAGKTTAQGGAIVDVKVNPSGTLTVDASGSAVTRSDDFYNDAFQRLRVSDTDQRFDGDFSYDLSPLLFDRIGSGGTITHDANSRDVVIAIAATTNGLSEGLRQHYANPYTKGNSQFVALTGVINGGNVAGGQAEVFLRSSITGSVVEQTVAQSAWLSNTTGKNWQYSHSLLMDFQSLKVGRVRFGLDIGGLAYKIAEITNDNIRAAGYWQLADQPTYWRQYNTATYTYTEMGYGDEANAIGLRYRVPVTASQSMRAICTTVKSEGGGDLHEIAGVRSSYSNGVTKKTVAATMIPVLSFQVKSTFNTFVNKGIVFPIGLEIATDNPIYYEVRINPTLTGASYVSVGANSILNYDTTATAITGGRVVKSGYASTSGNKSQTTATGILDKIPLSVSPVGVGDIITVCAVRDGSVSASVGAAVDFNEVR